MKINVEINEQTISEAAVRILTDETVKQIESGLFDKLGGKYDYLRKLHKENVQREVREIIKAHEAEIIDKAISEAAAILARKVWVFKGEELCR